MVDLTEGKNYEKAALLKTLGISLEKIEKIASGELDLQNCVLERIGELNLENKSFSRAQEICQELWRDKATWDSLDPSRYSTEGIKQETPVFNTCEERSKTSHKEERTGKKSAVAPWRRYFARQFDLFIYEIIVSVFHYLVFRKGIQQSTLQELIMIYLVSLVMVFIEPVFLMLWGTTPGKWLLGITVRNDYGNKLTYGQGLERTWRVFTKGMGFNFPVYGLVRMIMSFVANKRGRELAWEDDSVLELKDRKAGRIFAFIGGGLVLFAVLTLIIMISVKPPHKGELTTEQFAENYNYYVDYYGLKEELCKMNTDGELDGNGAYMYYGESERKVYLATENGIVTGLTVTIEAPMAVNVFYSEMQLLTNTYFLGQKGMNTMDSSYRRVLNRLAALDPTDFEEVVNGVTVSYREQNLGTAEMPGFKAVFTIGKEPVTTDTLVSVR